MNDNERKRYRTGYVKSDQSEDEDERHHKRFHGCFLG